MVSGTVGVISFAWGVRSDKLIFLVKNGGQEVNDWVINTRAVCSTCTIYM